MSLRCIGTMDRYAGTTPGPGHGQMIHARRSLSISTLSNEKDGLASTMPDPRWEHVGDAEAIDFNEGAPIAGRETARWPGSDGCARLAVQPAASMAQAAARWRPQQHRPQTQAPRPEHASGRPWRLQEPGCPISDMMGLRYPAALECRKEPNVMLPAVCIAASTGEQTALRLVPSDIEAGPGANVIRRWPRDR